MPSYRITPLREHQLTGLVALEQLAKAPYAAIDAGIVARDLPSIVALPKLHNVLVAEDPSEALFGWAAWRDESPGVAYIEELSVHPDKQRTGVARYLLDMIRNEARALRLPNLVTRASTKAPWVAPFLARVGFKAIDDAAPERARAWKQEQIAAGAPRQGLSAFWAAV